MKKIFNILNLDQKKRLLAIVFLLIILSFLEILTLFFFQGILSYFTNMSAAISLIKIVDYIPLKYSSIRIILFLFFLVYSLRCLFAIFINYKKNVLIKDINDDLSYSIFKNYLLKNFEFFLKKNSSTIISNIINEVDKFAYNILDAILVLFVELFVVFAVLLFLFFNYFNSSFFFIGIIFIFCFLFLKFFKNILFKLGMKKTDANKKKMHDLQNSLYSIQNIKLDHLEEVFANRFLLNTKIASKSQLISNFILDFIKPFIEFLVLVSFVLILSFFLFYLNFNKQEILMMLAIFVVAFFRILPSCYRIISSVNAIRYYYPAVSIISNEIADRFTDKLNKLERFDKIISFNHSIEFKNLSFSYFDKLNKVEVLKNVNLIIKKNQFIGITGDSGNGKTTFLNLVSYLLRPTSGSLLIDGMNLTNDLIFAYQNKIGFVSQNTYLVDGSIIDNIIFGVDKKNYNFDIFNDVINLCNINEFLRKLPFGKDEYIGEKGLKLSGGQKQRVGIARALYKRPEILILDEATSALDENNARLILNNIKKINNMTVVLVTHDNSILKFCDSVYKIENKTLLKNK